MTGPRRGGDVARLSLRLPARAAGSEIAIGRGLLARLPALLAEHAPAPRYAVIADANVAPLYGERLVASIRESGPGAELLTFPAGEGSKTTARWAALVEEMGARGFGRDACVIAVGGGVTGDLAGFAAASFARGVAFVQVPTSLLAMIDASIGGKTGIDLGAGKNLAGAFHQPRLVAIDPDALATLPDPELRTGLAEAVKHGAIADADHFDWLAASAPAIGRRDPDALDGVVDGSVRIKTAVVARDALEAGERAVLNFGHTVGHAVELLTEFRVPHGDAVAMGMVAEARIGEAAGITAPGVADRLRAALDAMGLPHAIPAGLEAGALLAAMGTDKKARAGVVRYALIRAIGEPARGPDGAWTVAVDDAVAGPALGREKGPAAPGSPV